MTLHDEKFNIFSNKRHFAFRYVFFGENSFNGASGHTCAAVNALVGVDQELVAAVVDALYGAHFGAGLVFNADAGGCDDMRHKSSMPASP